jgi:hypothetical protein
MLRKALFAVVVCLLFAVPASSSSALEPQGSWHLGQVWIEGVLAELLELLDVDARGTSNDTEDGLRAIGAAAQSTPGDCPAETGGSTENGIDGAEPGGTEPSANIGDQIEPLG